MNADNLASIMSSLCGCPNIHIEILWRSDVLDQHISWVEVRHRRLDAAALHRDGDALCAICPKWKAKPTEVLASDEEVWSDCWPDWNGRALDPSELEILAEKNAPGRVIYEAIMVLVPILGIVLLVNVVPTTLRVN